MLPEDEDELNTPGDYTVPGVSNETHIRVKPSLSLNGTNCSGDDIRTLRPGQNIADEALSFVL